MPTGDLLIGAGSDRWATIIGLRDANRSGAGVTLQFLNPGEGARIAYENLPGASPGVLFCPGFNSDMQGDKALALRAWCATHGRQFTRFDYSGHGQSSGRFEEGTIGQWLRDTLAVLDEVTAGPQLVVGSSMGGWIMLLAALRRPQRVAGLVGIAAAPDFTESLWRDGLDADQRESLDRSGYCEIPNCYDDGEPYRIGRQLLEEGRDHLLLDADIPIDLPVRLIHGQLDEDVPWEHSLTIARHLQGDDVEIQLVKDGDHRLSRPRDLARLTRTLDALLAELG
jgi:pimeloyl-ACP methyl ester carboxylesterase